MNLNTMLHWGEFAAVSAAMEHRGVPVNMEIATQLLDPHAWAFVRDAIVPKINAQYGVYEQDIAGNWSFSIALFEAYCARAGIAWLRHESGKLDLRDKTFDAMSKAYPETEALCQLRHTRNKMRKVKLAIGSDGRNRTVLWPFAGKTGRSQPKASEWIFSPAVWMRFLIKPAPGRALAYIDWSGMEFLIAASMSNCQPMLDLYATGIPYIGFAQRFDAAPPDATKKSHPQIHERYKVGCLGAQYSMQHVTLAQRLGISTFAAHEMLSQHRGLFSKYWAWVEDWIAHALNTGTMNTRMGWTCVTGITEFNARSIGNWPVQATGADILRLACIEGHRRGLQLCGSVHDAVLIESSLEQIYADVARMREIMRWASRIVLGDHELRTGVDIVRYPDSFYDSRGVEMWNEVLGLLEQYQRLKVGSARIEASHEEKAGRDPDEWDAEIEAEFQRITQQTKAGGHARRRSRHIGCPVAFMADVCRLTRGRATLVVAQCIYRRTKVCKTRTVTLPGDDLADLGIPRRRKLEALVRLCAAGLIKVETAAAGRTGMITLLWEEG